MVRPTYTVDDRARSDDGPVPNTDARKNCAVGSDMDILANVDLCSHGLAVSALQILGVVWRSLRIDGDVGANRGVPTDGDTAGIEESARCADFDVIRDGEIVAVVARKGRVDVNILPVMTADGAFVARAPSREDCAEK
jgi:hypothetical protein